MRYFKGATGHRLLPLSLVGALAALSPAAGVVAAPSYGHDAATVRSQVLQRWRGYALSRITPDFSWAASTRHPVAPPTVRDRITADVHQLRVSLGGHDSLALTLDVQPRVTAMPAPVVQRVVNDTTPVLGSLATPFSGSAARTGLSGLLPGQGLVDLSVVMVEQRFAASFLGGRDYPTLLPWHAPLPVADSSHGTGLELGLRTPLARTVDLFAAFRSRVDMDGFRNFRGIYGNPGDMDIPAHVEFGMAWQALPRTELRVGVERVKYSDIRPFVSRALPRHLLAVLGDATSPNFSWQDLDIYSVAVGHRFAGANSLSVRYSTGQQPRPTSPMLAQILMEDAPDYSVGLSFMHQTAALQWHLTANYAPAEFILGVPTSAHRDNPDGARQLEFESIWTWRF